MTRVLACVFVLAAGLGLVACHREDGTDDDTDLGNNDIAAEGSDGASGDLAGLPPGGCPAYQTFCNGACIPAVNDPNNCGGCGVSCTGSTFCWGGKCVATCPFDSSTGQGLKACGNACVDITTDNANCGDCGKPCTGGKVCSDGTCVAGIQTTPGPNACMGVGPPIIVTTPGGTVCSGNLAQTSFTWALCACEDVTINGNLFTDAFNSTMGPWNPGGQGGGVGMNGSYNGNQMTDVGGTLWTSSTGGFTANQSMAAHQDLFVNGPLDCNQQCTVGLDAHINGDITANATMSIAQTLYVPTNVTPPASVSYTTLTKGPVNIGAACACEPSQLVPVTAIVDARKTMNDNASIGLDPAVLANFGPTTRLDLPCGNYYLDSIQTNASLTIVAHGHTALYIGGDIVTNQNFAITVDPTGTFDIFVKGTIDTNGKFAVGSLNAPALTRLYLGSSSALQLNQGFQLAGNLYAGTANVVENQTANIYGAIFSRKFDSNQDTRIHYDTAITTQGMDCPTPTTDGGTPPGCGSCADCNNQACINGVCGNCGSDSDCCPPLTCVNGTCTSVIL